MQVRKVQGEAWAGDMRVGERAGAAAKRRMPRELGARTAVHYRLHGQLERRRAEERGSEAEKVGLLGQGS